MSMEAIAAAIAQARGSAMGRFDVKAIGGGCISSAFRLTAADGEAYFVKVNRAALGAMFEAEFAGLAELAATQTVRTPAPLCSGVAGSESYLVMEYLDLSGKSRGADRLLGQKLAELHRVEQPYFGWSIDNTIGSTPQPNTAESDWVTFWQTHRLGHQLELAAADGHGGRLQQRGGELIERLPALFVSYRPKPALLHGDLWGGNAAVTAAGEPVIYDPACYYGDREADLAMTELFGGFGADFYAAYREAYPLDAGYGVRKTLYNLYHILNHLNLFGGGYLSQAGHMIDSLLSELR